jgi:hypothetical protein
VIRAGAGVVKVLIQAGHSAQFQPYHTGGGGAPGEAAWATDLAAALAVRLRSAGIDVICVGAWLVNGVIVPAPALVTEVDYALFLSLHYDAAVYAQNTGGFADRARLDPVGAEADRFIRIWERVYPARTGIPLHNERRNANTWDYYAFRDTTANTPGVILEHGVGQGLDHAALFERIDEVARVDASCVLEYLGITNPEEADDMAKVQELQAQIDNLNGIIRTLTEQRDYKDELLQQANSRAGLAEAEVERLTKELTNADLRTSNDIGSVAVTRRDGRVDVLN